MNSKRISDVVAMLRGLKKVMDSFIQIQSTKAEKYCATSSLNNLPSALCDKLHQAQKQTTEPDNATTDSANSPDGSIGNMNSAVTKPRSRQSTRDVNAFIPESFRLPPVTGSDLEELSRTIDSTAFGLSSADIQANKQQKPKVQHKINITSSRPNIKTITPKSSGPILPTLADNRVKTTPQIKPVNKNVENRVNSADIQHKLSDKSRERRVPSGRLSRVASFGSLAAGLGIGAVAETVRRALGGASSKENQSEMPALLSEANMERIVTTLCRVRGAALKLGQMLSLQDSSMLNPQLQEVFERVRQSADFMPVYQMNKVMKSELGATWREKFKSFDDRPFAAASIGQVHKAVLHDGRQVAVKIQYPGVAQSISSDINNLMSILNVWQILPKGLYVENVMEVSKHELAWECDYRREAKCMQIFSELLKGNDRFHVPDVISELCSQRILTTELIPGVPLDKCTQLDQKTRNVIGHDIMLLNLTELYEWNIMQTDPNWSNFFYDQNTDKIYLLDFGATRQYHRKFVDMYIQVIKAAAVSDNETIKQISTEMGFLTGYETQAMVQAHIDAVTILGGPCGRDEFFDFGQQDITRKIENIIPVMLKHRLGPPPEETYSLHRKLSGSFLLCAKLKSQVNIKRMYDPIFANYKSGQPDRDYGLAEYNGTAQT